MKKFTTMLSKLLGIETISLKDGQLDLTQEQKNSVQDQLGAADMATMIEQVTAELKGVDDIKTQLQAAQQVATTAQQETAVAVEAKATAETKLSALESKVAELTATVNKLSDDPETVASVAKGVVAQATGKIIEIAGQLMGYEGKLWAMDRPWNARAVSGLSAQATDFSNQIVIDQLSSDIIGFQTQYPTAFDDIFTKKYNIPELWKKNTIYGVSDRLVSATIEVDEVTQGRKMYWNPKGGATIKAEVMMVRNTQIDLQFTYAKMQQIEREWIYGFNREGTQAYKTYFVQYLLTKYIEKARSEDADVKVRGLYVPFPDDGIKRVAPSYLFRHDGVLKIIFDAKINGKYRPFNLGKLTEANIKDKIHEAINLLPPDVRNAELQLDLSPYWIRAYKLRDELERGQNTNYDGYPANPKDYPNIEFVPVDQFEGTDIMFFTFKDNVKPLEFKPEEKSMFKMEQFLREYYLFADYRDGIGILHIGQKTTADDPLKFYKQAIWTNDVPLFNFDFYAVSYDAKNGILEAYHNRVQPENEFTTDIVEIEGNIGNFLFIRGDKTMGADVKVKKNAKLKLVSDFSLRSGGTLSLIKDGEGWKELSRTDAPEVASTTKSFDTATLSYDGATEFNYVGDAPVTLDSIVGGVEGNLVRIYGSAKALTVSTANNIKVNSDAVLASATSFIELVYVGGAWNELSRG